MKKLYFSALSIVLGLSLNAQTLTVSNHAPANGDQYSTYQCDSTGIAPGASGAGASWTYNTITPHLSTINNYTAAVNTNTAYPTASVAISSSTNNVRYFSSSATNLKYWGGNLALNGIPASITFTSGALYAAYPMSLGTTTSGAVSGSLTVFGNNGTFVGACLANADGTGTLALPGRTFTSVMRVVTTLTLNWTAAINGTLNQVTWDYYSIADSKYPIFSMNSSTVNAPPAASNSTQSFVIVQKNYQTVGLKDVASNEAVALSVYPNPATSQVSFVTESANAKSVSVYDISGKLLETQTLTNGKLNLNVSDYNNGLYIYKLIDSNNKTIKTGKITVTH